MDLDDNSPFALHLKKNKLSILKSCFNVQKDKQNKYSKLTRYEITVRLGGFFIPLFI